jgi:hypothetical protein
VVDRADLKTQFELLRQRQRASIAGETDEDLFPIWTLLAMATQDERAAAEAICGGSWDRGIDAVFVDQRTHTVWIIQGKFRREPGRHFEKADDVRAFARLGTRLVEGPDQSAEPEFWRDLARNGRAAAAKFHHASEQVRKHDYGARLVFSTLWKFNERTASDARKIVRRAGARFTLDLLGWSEIRKLLGYYIRDIAPAVPDLTLPILEGDLRPARMGSSSLRAWTIAATGTDVAALLKEGGEQIFARNIRLGLGDKVHVNRAITDTLRHDPSTFWFLNNGLTITCDHADPHGQALVMSGAQVINGQQTTRTLYQVSRNARLRQNLRRVAVAVRVVELGEGDADESDQLVSRIVEATNFQNSVSKADLRSNDIVQINLQRALGARGYRYVRKRGTHDPSASLPLSFLKFRVTREELATAVAGAKFESAPLREGQAPLFDPERAYYRSLFFNQSLDFMLACFWLWKRINSLASRNSDRQAAKYLVHYEAFRSLPVLHTRAGNFIRACEYKDQSVTGPLDMALKALFAVAISAYRENRHIDNRLVAIKPYHQRTDVSAFDNFIRYWNENRSSPTLVRFEQAAEELGTRLG